MPKIHSVSWTLENDYRWLVSVQDTGPGLPPGPASQLAAYLVPPNELTSIYQRHQEADPGLPPWAPVEASGQGLGLHIVTRLSELRQATLDVEVKPGVGTLLRVQLTRQSH